MRKVPRFVAAAAAMSLFAAFALYLAPRPSDDDYEYEDELCDHPDSDCGLDTGDTKAYRPAFYDGGLRKPPKDLFKE